MAVVGEEGEVELGKGKDEMIGSRNQECGGLKFIQFSEE